MQAELKIAANDNRRRKTIAVSFNKATLRGRLGSDPETTRNRNGKRIVRFWIATCQTARNGHNIPLRERTAWHHVVIADDDLAAVAAARLSKGCQVYVEGHLQTRHSADPSGNMQITTEVVLSGDEARLILLNDLGILLDHCGA